MMRNDLTEIVVILDRSGSMAATMDDAIGGFNTFIAEQKALPGEARISLVQFDDIYEEVYMRQNLADVKPLNRETYKPRGWTALLDAIGETVNSLGVKLAAEDEEDRPGKVIIIIITDGAENSSKEFNRPQIMEMISHQRDVYSWEFVFIGANQDAISVGSSLGISGLNSMTYAGNKLGTQAVFSAVSKNVRNYRSGIVGSMAFDDSDKKAQADAGVTS